MDFFPPNTLDESPDRHAFRERWYAAHLVAMRQSPLLPLAADGPTVYRLLFLPAYSDPAVVCLSEADGAWRVVCKRSDGLGLFPIPGKLVSEAEGDLSPTEASRFSHLLRHVAFWDMSSFEDSHGFDGSQAVLEGVHAGRYHVVDRWAPRDIPYAGLVEFMLGLCRGSDGRTV